MHTTKTRLLGAFLALATLGQTTPALAQLASFQTPYVTRAESLMLLLQARIPKIPALTTNGEFSDVPKGSWYDRYVELGTHLQIIEPHPVSNEIRPDDPVTRAEFLAMAAKAFGLQTDGLTSRYRDVAPDAWYAGTAAMAQLLELFPSDADRKLLRPDDFMIHTEVARAVQVLTDLERAKRAKTPVAMQGPQARNKLQLYRKISVRTDQVALAKPREAAPVLRTPGSPRPPANTLAQLRTEILRLFNEARAAEGLQPLQLNTLLETSAQTYAESMATNGFFGHVSPVGETLADRMEHSGYYRPFFQSECLCIQRYLLGENLAQGQRTAKAVVNDWMKSAAHREAILSSTFVDTGIGAAAGIWVAHFGGKEE